MIDLRDLAAVVGLVVLGVASSLVIGVVAGALRVLAKRGDPIATLCAMSASILSGQFLPLRRLPAAAPRALLVIPDHIPKRWDA